MADELFLYLERAYYYNAPVTLDKKSRILHIRGAGLVLKNPEYRHQQVMPDTLFEYIIDGEGYINYGGKRYTVKKGDCVISRSGEAKNQVLSYGSSTHNPYLKIWFTAGGSFVNSMFTAFNVKEQIIIKNCDVLQIFQDFVLSLPREGYNPIKSMNCIVTIMNSLFGDEPAGGSKTNDFENLVNNYIESNIQRPKALADAAQDLGMTTKSFGEYFKKTYGTTYNKYVMSQRMKYAALTLKRSNRSVSEIAIHLGFCDQSHFSKCFRKEFGIYPSEYRKQFFKCNK